jgi:hypothetical protein
MKVAKAKGRLRGKQPKLNPRQETHLVGLLQAGEHSTAELADHQQWCEWISPDQNIGYLELGPGLNAPLLRGLRQLLFQFEVELAGWADG